MKKNEEYAPKALREVWAWKDALYQDVKHLPVRDALHELLVRAHATAVRLGFAPGTLPADKPGFSVGIVAEGRTDYGAKKKGASS